MALLVFQARRFSAGPVLSTVEHLEHPGFYQSWVSSTSCHRIFENEKGLRILLNVPWDYDFPIGNLCSKPVVKKSCLYQNPDLMFPSVA